MDCNLCNCNFLGVFGAIACDDHFFKPNFFNFTAKYVECLDDATVAVQLEPTLIKPIKKGGFFNHEPSTFYSLIPSKRIVWFVAGNCTPSVNCIWCVNVCYVGKKHKKMSTSSQKERQRSWIEALDQNNTQSRKISEENVLLPKL